MNFDGQSKGTIGGVRRDETSRFIDTVEDTYSDVWINLWKKRSKSASFLLRIVIKKKRKKRKGNYLAS